MIILDKPINKVNGIVRVAMTPTYHYTYNLKRFYKVEVDTSRRGTSNSRLDRNYLYIEESLLESLKGLGVGSYLKIEGSIVTSRVQNKLSTLAVLVSEVSIVNSTDVAPNDNRLMVLLSGPLTSLGKVTSGTDSSLSRKFQVKIPLSDDGSKYVLPRISIFGQHSLSLDKYKLNEEVYVSGYLYSYKIKGAKSSKGGAHLQYIRMLAITEASYKESGESPDE